MEPENQTLKDIILQAKSGDRSAFDTLYRMYLTPVYRYIFMRLRNKQDAEDVAQETFLKAYEALPRYRDERPTMLPYLFTIARNLLINHTKKKRPELMEHEIMALQAGTEDTAKEAKDNELHGALVRAMEVLTDVEREVIELRFFGERSYSEIAVIMEKREDAIRQHVARSMKKLQGVMQNPEQMI